MSEQKNDGGPAFPLNPDCLSLGDGAAMAIRGMSLRDWFAGQALVGYLASRRMPLDSFDPDLRDAADLCVRIADAMLKVREQR